MLIVYNYSLNIRQYFKYNLLFILVSDINGINKIIKIELKNYTNLRDEMQNF